MRVFVARALITAFGLWIADLLLPGIRFDGALPLFLAALLLGVVNAIVRPIVVLLTLPITLVTLGLFLFVINGAMLLLVSTLLGAFHVEGLGSAILAWLIVALVGWGANAWVGTDGKVVVTREIR